jgi:hypothetical protein
MQTVEPPPAPASPSRTAGVLERSRLAVHVAMLAAFALALYGLYDNHGSLTLHIAMGVSFFALVVLHLLQRRQTVRRLTSTLWRATTWLKPRGRLAWSDAVLAFLTGNVLVSGSIDLYTGNKTRVPIPEVGMSWHVLSSLLLLGYLIVHILRRRARFSHSHVR